jgi:HlyD family secretion protein
VAKEKMKKNRKWLWIILGIVVVIGGIVTWRIWSAAKNAAQVYENLETEPYQRGDLSASIYGTGSVEPNQTAILTWFAGGIVGDVNVELGQVVEKDMVLMSLDPESVSVDIMQAQIDVINAQNALEDLYDNWETELAQAKLDLITAQDEFDDLEHERMIKDFKRCSDERIEELEDDLDKAERIYDFVQNEDNLEAINDIKATLDYCRSNYTEREKAEAALEVELGEAKVSEMQERVNILSEGPDPDEVTILETQLEIAQSRKDSILIDAPFDGVVTNISAKPGDVVQTGQQALRLDDLSELYLEVQISEVDIPQVKVGQTAGLVFDAYFEETFTGEVIEISPVGSASQGVVEYRVRVKMLDADENIKPGMTAAVNIVVEEKENIFVVPNTSIFSIDGQDHVFVQRSGSFETVPVTLGSYSDYYSEVVDADIDEGELIVINPPAEMTGETFFGNTNGSPSGFGFGN